MEFRPCIDIHNGKVKQIVGSSLKDEDSSASENFVSEKDSVYYAALYKKYGIRGGHVIMLNPQGSEYYEATKAQAIAALREYPGGLQIGGGITADNAGEFIEAGASAVIVTSYVFKDGRIDYDNLKKMEEAVGKEHLVLDLSCRYRKEEGIESGYYIMTDRWQHFTDEMVTPELLDRLSSHASEFLIHAVDVEGKAKGIETMLVAMLGGWDGIPVTYAGGVSSFIDIAALAEAGRGRLNVTIGSALDIFGGTMKFEQIAAFCKDSK